MPALRWIVAASAATALIALSGSITLALPAKMFRKVVLPLVAQYPRWHHCYADLVPELTTVPAPHEKAILTAGFAFGLILLLVTAALAH